MSVELIYDDGSRIMFDSIPDAIYHCYGPAGRAGVVALREQEDHERAGMIDQARRALEALGASTKGLPTAAEPATILDRAAIDAMVARLRDDPEVPSVLSVTTVADEDRERAHADNMSAHEAAMKVTGEALNG